MSGSERSDTERTPSPSTPPETAADANTELIRTLQAQLRLQQQQLQQQQQQIWAQSHLFAPQILPFDISRKEEWEDWVHLFKKSEFFKACTSEQQRIDRLEFSMGVQAAAELRKLRLKPEEAATFEGVVSALTVHFMGRKTVIYRRYLFRSRIQKSNESVERFITDVRYLAGFCKFAAMEDPESEMIRDQLVWGSNDQQLRETLLADPKLTLERVIRKMQAREQSHRENTHMAGFEKKSMDIIGAASVGETSTVERVTNRSNFRSSHRASFNRKSTPKKDDEKSVQLSSQRHCYNCGAGNFVQSHKEKCPAKGVKCSACGGTGHYAKMCRKSKSVSTVTVPSTSHNQSFSSSSDGEFYIDYIQSSTPPGKRSSSSSVGDSEPLCVPAGTRERSSCEAVCRTRVRSSVERPKALHVVESVGRRNVESDEDHGIIINEDTIAVVQSGDSHKFVGRIFFNGQLIEAKLDSGAEVSVIPPHLVPADAPIYPTKRRLKGAGENPLVVRGCVKLPLANCRKKIIETFFVVEQQTQLLIGAPAISRLGILEIDPWSRVAVIEPQSTTFEQLIMRSFPKLFGEHLGTLPQQYKIDLKPDAQPYSIATARNVALPMRDAVKQELQRMVDQKVIERVTRPTEWCAPMVVVRKKTGEVRICTDFTQLNRFVRRPRIILPDVESSLAEIGRSKVFSKLDAASGFWQIILHPACRDLTTFITPAGRFRYRRLPFGITSAPEFFQAAMSDLLSGLTGVTCHMDDVLVHGADRQEHDRNLQNVLKRMSDAGLVLKRSKCAFAQTTVKFLGQIVDGQCVKPDPDRVRAIAEFPQPETITGVRRLLGMVNQLAKFVPGLAKMSLPIRLLLKKDTVIRWDQSQQQALNKIVQAITRTTQLLRYDVNAPTALASDASNEGLGAVLLQTDDTGEWKPVSFGSRSLLAAERNYASIEKEALGVAWAVEKFRPFLHSKEFEILTDHQPLVSIFGKKDLTQVPLRIQRFKIRLLPYVFTVRHIPGRDLHIADFLSRHPLHYDETDAHDSAAVEAFVHVVIQETIQISEARRHVIAAAQNTDEECRILRRMVQDGWPRYARNVPVKIRAWGQYRNEIVENDQLLFWRGRVIIPCDMRGAILKIIHDGHLGINKCLARARSTVFWPAITDDITTMVDECEVCAKTRAARRAPLMHHEGSDRPWQRVGTDIFFNERGTFIIFVDYYSGFIELSPLERITSSAVIARSKEVFSRHGIPETVVSDAGTQFTGSEWREFAVEYGFDVITSSPNYHQSNGLAERGVQTVKSLLSKNEDIHLALLSHRSTPNASGYSPAELLMGRRIRTRLPFKPARMEDTDYQTFERARQRNHNKSKANYDRRHRVVQPKVFSAGDRVYVPDMRRHAVVIGPAEGPRSWLLKGPDGRQIRRNQQDLRQLQRSTPTDTQTSEKISEKMSPNLSGAESDCEENQQAEERQQMEGKQQADESHFPSSSPSQRQSTNSGDRSDTADPKTTTRSSTPVHHDKSQDASPPDPQMILQPPIRNPQASGTSSRPQRQHRRPPARYRDDYV